MNEIRPNLALRIDPQATREARLRPVGIDEILKKPVSKVEKGGTAVLQRASGPTVAEYFSRWIKEQEALARKAQLRDYRRHFRISIREALGGIALSDLRASDVRGFQADLLMRGKSVKYVRRTL